MASQPITSAHKRPYRFLSLDTAALLLLGFLACHWQGQTSAAMALGLAGTATLVVAGQRAMRATRRRSALPPRPTAEGADASLSRPHHS